MRTTSGAPIRYPPPRTVWISRTGAPASILRLRYASSQVDKRRAGRLAMAIQVAFQELGVFESSNTQVPVQDDNSIPFQTVQTVENAERDANMKRFANPMRGVVTTSAEAQSLRDAQSQIAQVLAPEISRHAVSMTMRRDGLVVSLEEVGFFDSGSAMIRPDAMDAITRLAGILRGRMEDIRVEGHTDNVPIHNSKFASNWELSTARATEMINLLITEYGLPPGRLSAAGYAEYHPVADNSTPAGRAQNRRLDIVILTPTAPIDASEARPDSVQRSPSAAEKSPASPGALP